MTVKELKEELDKIIANGYGDKEISTQEPDGYCPLETRAVNYYAEYQIGQGDYIKKDFCLIE